MPTSIKTPTVPEAHLRGQFAALRAQGLRARDAARRLYVSEGQAMAAHIVGHMSPGEEADSLYSVTLLDSNWLDLLQGLEGVGPVMALTRNESVVHEKVGVYRNVSARGAVGMALGAEIDLRLFLEHWHVGMHVVEHSPRGELHSLQFFDPHGQAVHKIHATPQTDMPALEQLAQRHACTASRPVFAPLPLDAPAAQNRADEDIDVDSLEKGWAAMRDTHDFFGLLKTCQASRAQSFRLMEGRFTRRLPLTSAQTLLEQAARAGLPIMVFAGNPGCLQIHTGAVHRIDIRGPWLNVLDEGFNLHLRTDQVAGCWLVSKPTADGAVTSVELFDAQERVIAMFFGERKPGRPELPAWRRLAQGLGDDGDAQAGAQPAGIKAEVSA